MALDDLISRIITEYDAKGFDKYVNDLTRGEKAQRQVSASGELLTGIYRGLGQTAATAISSIPGKLLDVTRESINLAREQRKVERQLDAVIRSTGGAAGVSAGEVKNLASALQGVTNFGDEATIRGQNLLLTFTNIGKDVFPEATKTMLDMSAALDQDLKSSAIQLGAALNDPIQGITRLQRVGVSFTADQKEQIKTLAESGDVIGAQTLILAELNKEFGGSAKAARDADGGFQAAANAVGDLQEVIGNKLIPRMKEYNDFVIAGAEGWTKAIQNADVLISFMGELNTETGKASEEAGFLGQALEAYSLQSLEKNLTIIGNYAVQSTIATKSTEELNVAIEKTFDRTNAQNIQVMTNGIMNMTSSVVTLSNNMKRIQDTVALKDTLIQQRDAEQARTAAAETAKIYEDLSEKRADILQRQGQRLQQFEFDHNQRIARMNEEAQRSIAEAATRATADREKAAQTLSKGLADIERKSAADRLAAEQTFQQGLARLNQQRSEIERDLGRNLANLANDTRQERLDVERDYQRDLLSIEKSFAQQRQQLNDAFSQEFAEADPFRRKILEFNKVESEKALKEQEAAEKASLENQRNTALTEIQDRVTREREILEEDARYKKEKLEQERANLEENLAISQQKRDEAAALAIQKLQERNIEELAQIDAREAEAKIKADEALAREQQNHADRLASMKNSNAQELAEVQGHLKAIEVERRASYVRQMVEAQKFFAQLRAMLSFGAGGSRSAGDTLPTGSAGRVTNNNVTVVNNGQGGSPFSQAVQTARSVQDILAGF